MGKAKVMNDVQEIQRVLEEYLGKRKARKVAVEISNVIQEETQHTHNEEVFFVHKDEDGNFVITKKSVIKENVESILKGCLEESELKECVNQLMAVKTAGAETIEIPNSNDPIYEKLMRHKPKSSKEANFIDELKKTVKKRIREFEVFVNDPSIVGGKLNYHPGFKPAVGYSYNEWEKIAKKNNLQLGTKDEYILFLGWLITSLINESWSETDAWDAVCTNSKMLGHYSDSIISSDMNIEVTGSRKFAGKCDLGNVRKILCRDKNDNNFWVAGGAFIGKGGDFPLADIDYSSMFDSSESLCVGWLVKKNFY